MKVDFLSVGNHKAGNHDIIAIRSGQPAYTFTATFTQIVHRYGEHDHHAP